MILIHIGNAKCGSSTIQKFFSDNRVKLSELSVFYPDVMGTNNHVNLAWEITERKLFNSRFKTISDVARLWRDDPRHTMVLSSEAFVGASPSGISRLKDVLSTSRSNEKFLIVLMIRDLIDLMPSSYAQKIKFGYNNYDFDTFFNIRIQEERTDYYKTALKWADVFGWESLRVRSLDSASLVNDDLLDDFLTIAGIDLNDELVREMPRVGVRNVRPGWKFLEAFRALYNDTHGLPETHSVLKALKKSAGDKTFAHVAMRVAEDLGWNNDKGLYLTLAQAKLCLEKNKTVVDALNCALVEKCPTPLPLDVRGFAERAFLPDVSCIPREELIGFYEKVGRVGLKRIRKSK